ncbi:MAG: galactofuranose ABC transporter, permease protein YjfF [Phycisphaerales bacterium]
MKPTLRFIPLLVTAGVALALYLTGCAMFPRFGSARVLVSLVGDNAFLGVAAVGATFVILSGGIDLSVGAVAACASILAAALIDSGLHPLAAITATLAAGAAFGLAQAALIAAFRLPAFLVTLAGMFLARGLGFVIHPRSLAVNHPFIAHANERLAIPLGDGLDWPLTATIFIAVLASGMILAHRTRFGLRVMAIGGDERAAALMGVPVARTRLAVYALAGSCSALAGVVYTFYTQSGDPAACMGLELDVIAAVVIGGTLLTGGAGFVAGTALGVAVLGLIQSLIAFHGSLNSWWTRIAVGVLVLLFVTLQAGLLSLARARLATRRAAP